MDVVGIEKVKAVTIAVNDQEQALAWFTDKLGFIKKADMGVPGHRWLTVAPEHQVDMEFLLASWFPELIGKNATCVLHTRDCRRTAQILTSRGVEFVQQPTERPYGVEAVFTDLHGNRYALVEGA